MTSQRLRYRIDPSMDAGPAAIFATERAFSSLHLIGITLLLVASLHNQSMSLLASLNAAKGKLKSVETRVLLADGREISEKRSEDGSFVVEPEVSNKRKKKVERLKRLGYVVDLKPDLQLAECAPGVFLGSQDVAADLNILRSGEITHIVNCATGIRNFFPKQFKYYEIELLDVPESDIKSHLFSATEYINEVVSEGGKVLVHCNAGISRSSTFVIAYVMKFHKKTLSEAVEQVKKARPVIRPNSGFMKQLEEYEVSLKEEQPTTTS